MVEILTIFVPLVQQFANINFNCTSLKWIISLSFESPHARIILYMRPANGRWRYIVMSSLIGWTHTQNDPCMCFIYHEIITLLVEFPQGLYMYHEWYPFLSKKHCMFS